MDRLRRGVLPALVLAYPSTFLVVQARPHCRPACGPLGPGDVGIVLATSALSFLLGAGAVAATERAGFARHPYLAWGTSPSRRTVQALAVTFVAFLGFLLVDAARVADGSWRLVPLLISIPLFAPAWALYVGTFVLAVLLPVVRVEPSVMLTTVVRTVVLVGGLGGSALWQYAVAETIVGDVGTDGDRSEGRTPD